MGRPKKNITKKEVRFVINNYKYYGIRDLADKMGCSFSWLRREMLKIKEVDQSIIKARTEATRFKKGNASYRTKKEGTIKVWKKSGKRSKRVMMKNTEGKWVCYAKHVYEKQNGKIPKGYVLRFKDGNQENCSIDNLKIITRIESVLENSINKFDKELIPPMVMIAQINNKLKEQENGQE